jgi:hypothetical protein
VAKSSSSLFPCVPPVLLRHQFPCITVILLCVCIVCVMDCVLHLVHKLSVKESCKCPEGNFDFVIIQVVLKL